MSQPDHQQIREFYNRAVTDSRLLFDFNLFHSSVSQKLWSVEYYRKSIQDLDINQFKVFPSSTATQSTQSAVTTAQEPLLDTHGYCLYMNLFLDGFFMNAMSVMDTLGHELYTLFTVPRVPRNIYISTANQMLSVSHNASETSRFLDMQIRQRWFIEFEPFRHCTTHESLIRYDNIKFSYDQVENKYKLTEDIKLPDNPQTRPFTFTRRRVAINYCNSIVKKLNDLVNGVYGKVLRDFHSNGNVFPIP